MTITVSSVNDAPFVTGDSVMVNEDGSALINILQNDVDVDGFLQPASTAVVTTPIHGTVSVNTANGKITYSPTSNYNGNDSFTYIVMDNEGLSSNLGIVTITVDPLNDVPVANNDITVVESRLPVTVSVIANDIDIDSTGNLAVNHIDPQTVEIVTEPSTGQISIVTAEMVSIDNSLSIGDVIYTPSENFSQSDSFTYRVKDTLNTTSNLATVTISAGNIPLARPDIANTDEDVSKSIDILANDFDLLDEISQLNIAIIKKPANGSVKIDLATGEAIYQPNLNYHGTDSFSYTVKHIDSDVVSNEAVVSITVNSINDAPLANDNIVQFLEDSAHAINVLGNDIDVDTLLTPSHVLEPSSVSVITQPNTGIINIDPLSGIINYTPNENFSGTDTLSYTVKDSDGLVSNIATVTITVTDVNDAPVAVNDAITLFEDATQTSINVIGNDSDIDGMLDVASVLLVTPPTHGNASIDSITGDILYTPNANYEGNDVVTYSVNDSDGLESNIATVTITISSVNDAPIATDDSINLMEDDTQVRIDVTVNDSDIDGTIDITSVKLMSTPTNGTATVNATNGSILYTPDANFHGSDSFTYSINDNESLISNIATVALTVQNVDDIPEISSIDIGPDAIVEGQEFRLVLDSTYITDHDADELTIVIENLPNWLTYDSKTHVLSGVPKNDDVGNIDIIISLSDGNSEPVTQTLALKVNNTNDLPFASNDFVIRNNWQSFEIKVLDNDGDIDGDSINVISATVDSGNLTWTNSTLTYQPENGFEGAITIEYTIGDSHGGTDTAFVLVDINVLENELPVITVPDDIEVNATALATKISLGVATALDSTGNDLSVTLQNESTFFPPGISTVLWRAVDTNGLTSIASQQIRVNPLVSIENNQTSAEGYSISVGVYLNGLAPSYPLTIPYTVSGTAQLGLDHNLESGSIVIESGTQAFIRFTVAPDTIQDNNETIIITLDNSLNLGSKSQHIVTIKEEGIAPLVTLTSTQNDQARNIVTKNDALVSVSSIVEHPLKNKSFNYQWTSTPLLVDEDASESMFTFDPSQAAEGVYTISLTVRDNDDSSLLATSNSRIVVKDDALILTNEDTDLDGIPDNLEGIGDSDNDGIPDYLDAIVACNILPESLDYSDDFLIESEPGICLKLGDVALSDTTSGAEVNNGLQKDSETINVGGVFDFIAYNLPVAGQSSNIVLPQLAPVPVNAIYRKTNANGDWVNFVETQSDKIWSAVGEKGYCPPPGSGQWVSGLVAGSWCIQLTIVDGGPNDADGLVNNTIVDPGGIAVLINDNQLIQANDDIGQTRINHSITIDVLNNDTNNDNIRISTAHAKFGVVNIENNKIVYQPLANYVGVDTIIYGIIDDLGGSNFASVALTVIANVAPTAQNDMFNALLNTESEFNVLINDSDQDGDSLSVISAESENGIITITKLNTLLYTPNNNYLGADTITYTIKDSLGALATAQVTVTVKQKITVKTSSAGALLWLIICLSLVTIYRTYKQKVCL